MQHLQNTMDFLRNENGVERLIFDTIDEVNNHPQQNQNQSGRSRQSQLLLKRIAREEGLNLFERTWSGHRRLLNLGQTCDFIISWYAETILLRTCIIIWHERSAFSNAIITEWRSDSLPRNF